MKKYDIKPDAETLDIVNTAAREKEVNVLMKIYWGDPGTLKRVIMGSVSNYIVNNATCPVAVKH